MLLSEIPKLNSGRIELKRLSAGDSDALSELVKSPKVYRYLPTFLFEKQYPDVNEVIQKLYGECLKDSIILGIFENGVFAGLQSFTDTVTRYTRSA